MGVIGRKGEDVILVVDLEERIICRGRVSLSLAEARGNGRLITAGTAVS